MLSLVAANYRNKVFYIGEAEHRVHGKIHVFGISFEISCNDSGNNFLVIPIPGTKLLLNDQIIEVGNSTFSTCILEPVIGKDENKLEQLDCSVALLSGTDQLKQKFSQFSEIDSFSSLIGEFYPEYQFLTCQYSHFSGYRKFSVFTWYKPAKPDELFLPTLIGTASMIDFNKDIHIEYWALMSALKMSQGLKTINKISNTDSQSQLLPKFIVGKKFEGWYKNADTVSSVEGIEVGLSDAVRRRPFFGLWHG